MCPAGTASSWGSTEASPGCPRTGSTTGDESNPLRRLVSTFLSPLATAYVLVVVLLVLAAPTSDALDGRRRPRVLRRALVDAHERRSSRSRLGSSCSRCCSAAGGPRGGGRLSAAAFVFVKAYPTIGPSTSYTGRARISSGAGGGTTGDPLSPGESSVASHWRNLRDGVETVLRHPQGYGLGNTGVTAKRTGVEIKAEVDPYTELGVDAGTLGAAAFVAWCIALLLALRRWPGLAAAFAGVLVLGLQSDVIGIHWLAFCLWAGAGVGVTAAAREERSLLAESRIAMHAHWRPGSRVARLRASRSFLRPLPRGRAVSRHGEPAGRELGAKRDRSPQARS